MTYKNLPNWLKELREYRPEIPCLCAANKIDGEEVCMCVYACVCVCVGVCVCVCVCVDNFNFLILTDSLT